MAFVRAYAAQGNVRMLNATLAQAGFGLSPTPSRALRLAMLGARELRAHGHRAESDALFARAAGAAVAGTDPEQSALALYETSKFRDASALYARLMRADSNNIEYVGRFATSALLAGDTAGARMARARLSSWPVRNAMGAPAYWLAHVAAGEVTLTRP